MEAAAAQCPKTCGVQEHSIEIVRPVIAFATVRDLRDNRARLS